MTVFRDTGFQPVRGPRGLEARATVMVKLAHERVLLIGDTDRQIQSALVQAVPGADITTVASVFDAIAELTAHRYSSVLAAAEPIERRPEAAVKTLRKLTGEGRLLLFGHPTLEPLSRKMLEFGCDDYIVTPASPAELGQMFGAPAPLRVAPETREADSPDQPLAVSQTSRVSLLMGLPLAEILLDAILQHPNNAPAAAIAQINSRIAPTMQLSLANTTSTPQATEGMMILSHALRLEAHPQAHLHLAMPRDEDETAARQFLAQLSLLVSKVGVLEDRFSSMKRLAITDDLTGLYNGRYFRHFLSKTIEKGRAMRSPVTLLLFDIDDFKKYNDLYGHGVGDEILKQTATLMRRCCRDQDLVARISGDEFAVVFWEKEGPRQPRENLPIGVGVPGRPPADPEQVFARFKRLIASPEYQVLGTSGKGSLTISGGLAVYPYDGNTPEALIDAADKALMFGAKKSGKNNLFLVGGDEPPAPPTD
jgi:GGDEF domain-containing protein